MGAVSRAGIRFFKGRKGKVGAISVPCLIGKADKSPDLVSAYIPTSSVLKTMKRLKLDEALGGYVFYWLKHQLR